MADSPFHSVAHQDLPLAIALADFCDQFDDAFIAVNDSWRVLTVNSAAEALGVAGGQLAGQVLWEGAPELVGAPLEALLRRSMSEREPFEATLSWPAQQARQFTIRCFLVGSGLGVCLRDVTAQAAQSAAVQESEARFRAIAALAPTLLWVTRPDISFEFVNQALLDFTGVAPELLLGAEPPMMLIHPDDRAQVERTRDEAVAAQMAHEFVARVQNASGEWRWLRFVSQPRFDPDGHFLGYIGTAMDVTELRQAEMRQRLLVNELNHRVKNSLATVQSFAQQSLRRGVELEVARERFLDRLLSLSAAYNVLDRECWQGADLLEIAEMTLRPYAEAEQIRIRGCSAGLAPNIALAMAIALHELADNAVRHGALSQPGGRVCLAWTSSPASGAVRLRWREQGGSPVKPPGRRGFGMRLLTEGLRGELGSPAQVDLRAVGLTCTVTVPCFELEAARP